MQNFFHKAELTMAQGNQQEILQRYIERVVALQNERRQALELSDLKGIARDLGMSEEDMQEADRAAEASLERGLRHIRYGRWDDAISELNDAVALNPTGVEPLHSLATAYKERWQRTGNRGDSLEAARLARQTLSIVPDHDPSYLLLNELDRKGGTPAPAASTKKAAAATFIITAPVLIVICVVIGIIIGLYRHRRPDPPIVPEPPITVVPTPMTGTPVPVIWETPKDPDMGIEIAEMNSSVRGNHRTLQLMIRNVGKEPIESLELEITDYSPNDEDEQATEQEILSEDDPPLNPGESRIRFLDYEVEGNPDRYTLSVISIE